mgnify:CR=1 FL=1
MPKVTEAHRQARRKQILTAAFTCFARDGFHGTTMKDICEEADLSPGAVYNYFDSKDDIIRAHAEGSQDSLDALSESIDRDRPAPQVLADFVERLGAFVEQPGDAEAGGHRMRVRMWGEALSVSEIHELLENNQTDFVEHVAEMIREGQAEGSIRTDVDAEVLARALMALHQGMVLQRAISPEASVTPVFETMSSLIRDAAS